MNKDLNDIQMHNVIHIKNLIQQENERQASTISLIASENCCSQDVRNALGSRLTDKYIEGMADHRYYHGCSIVDQIEKCAIQNACKLFGATWANVQSHSGSQANQAVFAALLNPDDCILGLDMKHGGHLTHGSRVNISGKLYHACAYKLNDFDILDIEDVRRIAYTTMPKIIIAGASAYSLKINWSEFRQIADEVGAYLLCDIAHYAGLIAGKAYPNPLPYAHIVTSTTHKTLRGPRGGLIMSNDIKLGQKIDKAVFPGIQGGAMAHAIAGKAICFAEAMSEDFIRYAHCIVDNAKTMCKTFQDLDWKIVSDGTECHLFTLDLGSKCQHTGREAADLLEKYGIIVNMQCIPNDMRSPMYGSGIRIGTASMTSRGMGQDQALVLAHIIDMILTGRAKDSLREDVKNMAMRFALR